MNYRGSSSLSGEDSRPLDGTNNACQAVAMLPFQGCLGSCLAAKVGHSCGGAGQA